MTASSDPAIWAKIRAGDEEARAALIEANYGLVQRIAGKMARKLPPHVDVNDIISFGTLGLMRAVENYKADQPVHFETYAAASIRSLILDELRSMDWAPRSLRRRQRAIDEATTKLRHSLQREPTAGEVADEVGIPVGEVSETLQATKASYHRSLDEGDPERDWGCSANLDPSDEDNEDVKRAHEAMERLIDVIRELPILDQAVLTLKYFVQVQNPRTGEMEALKLKTVGERLGITEFRASQVHSRAVVQVRDALRNFLQQSERFDEAG